jgi:hypothetical protein
LLRAFKESRGKNEYLKERYVSFILKYAPPGEWEQFVEHPHQHILESAVGHGLDRDAMHHVIARRPSETYPDQLSAEQLNDLLGDSYSHRSCFIHRGEQPPHTQPGGIYRFFQESTEVSDGMVITRLLPNFDLMLAIAQRSITAWANKA